jgi:hypothetical protein
LWWWGPDITPLETDWAFTGRACAAQMTKQAVHKTILLIKKPSESGRVNYKGHPNSSEPQSINQGLLLSAKEFFWMSTEIDPIVTRRIGRREIGLGLFYGLCGLIGVAVFLNIADPYLRGPDGAVFSFTEIFGPQIIKAAAR